ncbi:hypothetical protein IIA28_08930 [candidate division KSB1 bacterium]|nr:hypothetical protein [candidate division KSB1 bacterium]
MKKKSADIYQRRNKHQRTENPVDFFFSIMKKKYQSSANRNTEERREGSAKGFILTGGIAKTQFRQDKQSSF